MSSVVIVIMKSCQTDHQSAHHSIARDEKKEGDFAQMGPKRCIPARAKITRAHSENITEHKILLLNRTNQQMREMFFKQSQSQSQQLETPRQQNWDGKKKRNVCARALRQAKPLR
jgi:hypothetical protein